eukprot:2168290-Pleurochrysis_carterae.AAC.1
MRRYPCTYTIAHAAFCSSLHHTLCPSESFTECCPHAKFGESTIIDLRDDAELDGAGEVERRDDQYWQDLNEVTVPRREELEVTL